METYNIYGIMMRMLDITEKCTTCVRGVAVTRWGRDSFEVGTLGERGTNLLGAAIAVTNHRDYVGWHDS